MANDTKRLGRPPSTSPFAELLHVRISSSMAEWLDKISKERLDEPSQAALVREALAEYIARYRTKK